VALRPHGAGRRREADRQHPVRVGREALLAASFPDERPPAGPGGLRSSTRIERAFCPQRTGVAKTYFAATRDRKAGAGWPLRAARPSALATAGVASRSPGRLDRPLASEQPRGAPCQAGRGRFGSIRGS
jgi:hypothetical protein